MHRRRCQAPPTAHREKLVLTHSLTMLPTGADSPSSLAWRGREPVDPSNPAAKSRLLRAVEPTRPGEGTCSPPTATRCSPFEIGLMGRETTPLSSSLRC